MIHDTMSPPSSPRPGPPRPAGRLIAADEAVIPLRDCTIEADADRRDPVGGMQMSPRGFADLTRSVRGVADRHAPRPESQGLVAARPPTFSRLPSLLCAPHDQEPDATRLMLAAAAGDDAAARAMRRILVDHARAKAAGIRGGPDARRAAIHLAALCRIRIPRWNPRDS